MAVYYNEFDPKAAEWLRNLIREGLIADGDVDDRPIQEVTPADVRGYDQCHWFAGIGGWSLALRLAGVPDDTQLWTGSCPCQPFSAAGKQKGNDDDRHIWPIWYELIRECKPGLIIGEQVASAAVVGLVSGDRPKAVGDAPVWFDGVSNDLEAAGYAVGAAVLPACSVGAPHIRQRLWWVGVAESYRNEQRGRGESRNEGGTRKEWLRDSGRCGIVGGLSDSASSRPLPRTHRGIHRCEESSGPRDVEPERFGGACTECDGRGEIRPNSRWGDERIQTQGSQRFISGGSDDGLSDAERNRLDRSRDARTTGRDESPDVGSVNPWSDTIAIYCRGLEPLAHGVSAGLVALCSRETGEEIHEYNRVAALRGLGNSIVPQVAAEFIRASMDVIDT